MDRFAPGGIPTGALIVGGSSVSTITQGVGEQYADSRKLAARARLHTYTIAEVGWFPWVARQLPIHAGDRVLDIGCGPGWFWASVADQLPERFALTLADRSAGMVSEAVERCGKLRSWTVEGQEADAAHMPFADGTFDTVVAMHMMYHLADQAAGIAEMYRVLKPGGWLAVTTNGAGNMREMYALTSAFGSAPQDPAGIAFGYDTAERLMRDRFGNVTFAEHPARMKITDPEDVFLALTSYPPGDGAGEAELAAFRAAIDRRFRGRQWRARRGQGDRIVPEPQGGLTESAAATAVPVIAFGRGAVGLATAGSPPCALRAEAHSLLEQGRNHAHAGCGRLACIERPVGIGVERFEVAPGTA